MASSRSTARSELRDALDDAIRQTYCEPVTPPVEGEDPEVVRAISRAAIIVDPDRMRRLAAIQAAAWAVVDERVEDSGEDDPAGVDSEATKAGPRRVNDRAHGTQEGGS